MFATQLSDSLARRGHEVRVIGLFPGPLDALEPAHAAWADLRASKDGRIRLDRLSELRAYLQSEKPDIVQANGSQTLKYASLVRRLSGRDFVLVYRNISIASQWVRGPLHRAWGRWLVRGLDHTASVSAESCRDFKTTYAVPDHQCSVIHRGIPVPLTIQAKEAREQLQALTGVCPRAPILVHVGSFSEEKNQVWLLEAFRRVRRSVPEAHLMVIGDGALRGRIEAYVQKHELSASVHLLGLRSDAAALVAGADIFVLTSTIEGVPGAVLEASAQSVPTVSSDVGGIREAVVHGESGLLVMPGDIEGFVSSVLQLLGNSEQRNAMGKAARAHVMQRFNIETATGAFEELYGRLLSQRPL